MTPKQLRKHAAMLDEDESPAANDYRAHADALEELAFWKSAHIVDVRKAELRAEAALAEAERKIERLKFHAEAMADALSAWVEIEVKEVAAYRAEFKEG